MRRPKIVLRLPSVGAVTLGNQPRDSRRASIWRFDPKPVPLLALADLFVSVELAVLGVDVVTGALAAGTGSLTLDGAWAVLYPLPDGLETLAFAVPVCAGADSFALRGW